VANGGFVGYRSRARVIRLTGVPATPDMRFRAGSVGIAFMNVVLMQPLGFGPF